MVSASFLFSIMLFNIVMAANEANAQEIQIIHEDIKAILQDTGFIKGMLEE